MNYGSDPADQVVRFTLEGTEMALRLSGLAAKNFALFVYAVLKDQKKTRGKTRLVRMLREQRPFKFFKIPAEAVREFAREAKNHGLLYVPIRNKLRRDEIEMVVFADDAAKIQRVLDNLNLDFVRAQAGEAAVEPVPAQETPVPEAQTPNRMESVQLDGDTVQFEIGGAEDEFNLGGSARQDTAVNFTVDREPESGEVTEKNPSAPSSNSRNGSPGSQNSKPSVKEELREIRREQEKKHADHLKTRERRVPKHYKTKER